MKRAFLLMSVGCALFVLFGQETSTVIYANESWYRERPEAEREWTGVLRPRQPVHGPASRTALRFTLVGENESLPVYAPGSSDKLQRFTGVRVSVRAKLVDLSSEGYGRELWIGTLRPAR